MNGPHRASWVRAAIVAGIVYFIIGRGSAEIDPFVPDPARFPWRVTSWVLSAALFVSHIKYERRRLGSTPRELALHTSAAVALGGFLLAVAAMAHAFIVEPHASHALFLLALFLWPAITALPAFVVALVAGTLFDRRTRKT